MNRHELLELGGGTPSGLLASRAAWMPDKTAFVFRDQTYTYRELDAAASQIAAGLLALGLDKGDAAGFFLFNRAESFTTGLGVNRAGLVGVPINSAFKAGFLRGPIERTEAKVVFTESALAEAWRSLGEVPSSVKVVVFVDEVPPDLPAGTAQMLTLAALTAQGDPDQPFPALGPDDINGILFTSGTTGRSKGVVCPNLMAVTMAKEGAHAFAVTPRDRLFTCFPTYHGMASVLTCLAAVYAGATAILSPGFSVTTFWDEVRDSKATQFNALGVILHLLLAAPESDRDLEHSVTRVFSAPAPADVLYRFETRFGVRLVEGYGQTEIKNVMYNPPGDRRIGSMGRPTASSILEIHDEAGNRLPAGEVGELVYPPPPAARHDPRLPRRRRSDPGQHARPVVAHRRHGLNRRRGLLLLLRPQDRLAAPPRREHLLSRGRRGAGNLPRSQRRRRGPGPVPARRARTARRRARRRPGRIRHPRPVAALRPGDASVHGAALHPGGAGHAVHPHRQGPQGRAARRRHHRRHLRLGRRRAEGAQMSNPAPSRPGTAFDVVDAQVHLTLDMDERRILDSMDALGIRSVLLDEFWYITDQLQGMPCAPLPGGGFRPLSPYAQAAALRRPDRFSYTQRVERRDPELPAVMRLLAASPGCRSLRLLLLTSEQRTAFGAGGYDEVLSHAQSSALPVSVLGVDVATLPAVTGRFPQLQIVLDHAGWPRSPQHWEQILQTGALPTVFLKWSHPSRAFGGGGGNPADSIQREFLRALEAFGVERVLWASDITQDESGASWAELLGFVRDNPALSVGDKEWVLSRTARSLFGWDAPPPAS